MEIWFILSLVAAVFAGLHIFITKVASVRGYNSSLLNSYSTGISAVMGFVVAGFFEGYVETSWGLVTFGLVGGVTYIIGANLRMDSLKYIDTTICLPLHKFIGPLAALFIGVFFFKELLTTSEWLGIGLGMVVPLLLINGTEKSRQKNLSKGLLLMLFSAIFAAVSAAVNKEATDIYTSALLFAAFSNLFGAGLGALIYRFRKRDVLGVVGELHFADKKLLSLALISGIIQFFSFGAFVLAFAYGGSLAIVYTVHSLYILIPIVLSIIFYNEHWNLQKAVAIIMSVASLALLG